MTKKEWQKHHGFTDADMDKIELLVKTFNADKSKILVFDKKPAKPSKGPIHLQTNST